MFNSLIIRVIVLNVLLLAIGIGGFAMYHLNREQGHRIDVNRQNAQLLLNTIERSIFHSMCVGNSANVQAILEKVGSSDELIGVRIFNPEGIVLRSDRPDALGKMVNKESYDLFLQEKQEAIYLNTDGLQVFTLLQPISASGRCVECHDEDNAVIGILNLDISLAGMYSQLKQTSRTFVASTLLILFFLTVGIALSLIRLLRRPLQQVTQGVAQVATGDLSVRMPDRGNDEIGQLMRGFNSMVSTLDKTQNELQVCHYQQMERAERLASIGEMAAGLAHEIKNPLAGIGGAIDVLADDYSQGDPRREIMRQIKGQINRLNKTVTDLLYFGKPGDPEFADIDINSLIQQTLLFSAQHPEAKNIKLIEELTSNLPLVWGDQKQLQQVLLNIMINGLQAMPDGGDLTVQTDQVRHDEQDWLRIKICDTGPGLSADEIKNIFIPFYTTKTQGTGLGLPICRQLVKSHGGTLEVDAGLGEGACFTIELPMGKKTPGT